MVSSQGVEVERTIEWVLPSGAAGAASWKTTYLHVFALWAAAVVVVLPLVSPLTVVTIDLDWEVIG